jgi:hypothetical protein
MPDPDSFFYDVFISHSAKDKAVVRPLAERLRNDGVNVWFDEWELKPGDSIPAKLDEGLERSRVLVLCMSVNAFGSDWPQLESVTFRFRDPLNKGRRFIPLRLDDAPIKGSLAQFVYIAWLPPVREQEYAKLLEACRPSVASMAKKRPRPPDPTAEKVIQLDSSGNVSAYAFAADGKRALTSDRDGRIQWWDLQTGQRLRELGRVSSQNGGKTQEESRT